MRHAASECGTSQLHVQNGLVILGPVNGRCTACSDPWVRMHSAGTHTLAQTELHICGCTVLLAQLQAYCLHSLCAPVCHAAVAVAKGYARRSYTDAWAATVHGLSTLLAFLGVPADEAQCTSMHCAGVGCSARVCWFLWRVHGYMSGACALCVVASFLPVQHCWSLARGEQPAHKR
jgi:hypothetical protein